MINWLMLAPVTLLGVAAVEFTLRRTRNDHAAISFQPLWMQRLLLMIIVAGAVFTAEMVRFALDQPSVHRIWYILFSAAVPFISMFLYALNEVSHANNQMMRVNPGAKSVVTFVPGKASSLSGAAGALIGIVALFQVPRYALAHPGVGEIGCMAAGIVVMHLYLAMLIWLEFKYARRALQVAQRKVGNGNSRLSHKNKGARK